MPATEIDATITPPLSVAENPAPAENLPLKERVRVMLSRLSDQQKILLMVSGAILIALVAVSALWLHEEEYRVLFSNLSERDGGVIIAALEQQNIPYKLSAGGSSIHIPSERVYEVRLRLATQGLPKGGNVGFELMENQKFGISQFAEQINFQRALEGELSKTIQSIAAVQESRVHLAIPKPTVFIREELKPSASVFLSLYPGRFLEPLQIAGIQNLVAASIPNLSPSKVTIIDQNGVLISQTKNRLLEAGLDPTQIKYIQEIEAIAIKRIEDILLPIAGKGNARVQVAADIDFSQSEQTAETHRPNTTPPDIAIRSQQTSESSTRSSSPQGVPGALTNQPPVPATAPINQPDENTSSSATSPPLSMRRDSTTNYEVDRTIRHTKYSVGIIRRLSAAVVINHRKDAKGVFKALPEAELRQIEGLVKEAMGFSAERGDTVSVANASFTASGDEAEVPFWKKPETLLILSDMLKYILIAAIAAYLIFKVIRPLVKVMLKDPEEEKKAAEAAAAAAAATAATPAASTTGEEQTALAQDATEGGAVPGGAPGTSGIPGAPGTSGAPGVSGGGEAASEGSFGIHLKSIPTSYEQMLTRMREIAQQDPKAIADIIKDWTGVNANN